MITYHVHELPNIDCRISHQMCHCVEKLRSEATLFIESLLNQRPAGAPLAPPQVAIALLCRVNELAASAEMLVIKQRARDASILILAGYELLGTARSSPPFSAG